MLLGERTGVWSGGGALPYDREVACLISHGTEYIDTGVVLGEDFYNAEGEINLDFEMVSLVAGNQIFGASPGGWKGFYFYLGKNGYVDCAYKKGAQRLHAALLSDRHTVSLKKTGYSIDGGNSNSYNLSYNGFSDLSVILFGIHENAGVTVNASFKCYGFSIDGKLNYKPVVKDGVGYMYDEVSGQLFGNARTGAFTWEELNA